MRESIIKQIQVTSIIPHVILQDLTTPEIHKIRITNTHKIKNNIKEESQFHIKINHGNKNCVPISILAIKFEHFYHFPYKFSPNRDVGIDNVAKNKTREKVNSRQIIDNQLFYTFYSFANPKDNVFG